jgi:uncharacterized membrane protein YoaK (UPF0700 family)
MKSVGQEAVRDLLLLSLTAGSADAAGFLGLDHVFTSNMTGNLVLMGIELGQGQLLPATRVLYVLAIFFSGACLGAWLGRKYLQPDWPTLAFRLIGMEKIVLLLFGIGWFCLMDRNNIWTSHLLLALLALAMGLQSAAMGRLSAPGVATTAVTGTVTALATGAMSLLFIPESQVEQKEASRSRVKFQLGVVLLYGGGAALSGWLIVHFPRLAGCLPMLAVAFVAPIRPKP